MPGPQKSFDVSLALEQARDVFWRHGYDGSSMQELESALGIGRKSLYDTFGNKRSLFLQALEQYCDSVIAKICEGLADPRNDALTNLERVLGRLQKHHGSEESRGCLLGVAMGQADASDAELAALLRRYLERLERAFEAALRQAKSDRTIRDELHAKDAARQLVALTQGMALLGRISSPPAVQRSIARAALESLRR